MDKYDMNILNEQKSSLNTKLFAIIELLTWLLISLAICSCLWRNDCNVLVGLIIILILNRKFDSNPTYYCKILIHILIVLIIVDTVWMFLLLPYWNDSNNEKLYTATANTLHNWVTFFSILELIMKLIIIYFFIRVYKSLASLITLFNIKYS